MRILHKFRDQNLQVIIGNILRYGVYVSLFFTIIGGAIFLIRNGNEPMHHQYAVFHETDNRATDYVAQAVKGCFQGNGRSIITLGILVLLVTPTLRVICSLLGFVIEKDKMYIVITLLVLIIIGISIRGGLG